MGTVTISIEEYDFLRECKKTVEEEHSFLILSLNRDAIRIVSSDEVVKRFCKENESLYVELLNLKRALGIDCTYDELIKMNYWKFKKMIKKS